MRSNTLVIQTAEGISFPLPLASPVIRFLAWLIDLACISTAISLLSSMAGLLRILSWDIARAFAIITYFVFIIAYPIVTEWYWRGQTVGKRVLHIRVVDVQGLRLKFSQIAIRNLLRLVDSLPVVYMVGGLIASVTRYGQRLGDLAANTIVIRTPEIYEPDLKQITGGKFNSLREHPHLAARLRHQVSVQEANIALQALLRRDDLDPLARIGLFERLALHFEAQVPFPTEATEGLTPEQYVRNIVDILYRR
jgi:uncharacterized RDD family membrane protein YckC